MWDDVRCCMVDGGGGMCDAVRVCAVGLSACCVANAAAVVASAGDWGGDVEHGVAADRE